jgi:hypothetical protein
VRVGDPDHELLTTWQLKEALRDVYRAADAAAAREALDVFYLWAAHSGVDECRRLARTIRRWEREVLAWHTTGGASNGPTEAVNLAIKHIKRVGRGFKNFENYRLRLLLHCDVDWHTPATAQLRTRAPPLSCLDPVHYLPYSPALEQAIVVGLAIGALQAPRARAYAPSSADSATAGVYASS